MRNCVHCLCPKSLWHTTWQSKLYAKSGQGECADQVAQEAMQVFGLDHTLAAGTFGGSSWIGWFSFRSFDPSGDARVKRHDRLRPCDYRFSWLSKMPRARHLLMPLSSCKKCLTWAWYRDVGLCHSFLSTIEKPELEDFVMLDGIVSRFQVRLDSTYVTTYLRKLLLLSQKQRSDAQMQKHLRSVPMDRLQSGLAGPYRGLRCKARR